MTTAAVEDDPRCIGMRCHWWNFGRGIPLLLLLGGALLLALVSPARSIVNFHLDVTRYLYEGKLVADGQTPYLDFTWQYPPAGVYLLGWWFDLFGVGLAQAAYFFSLCSLVILLACFSLLLRVGASSWEAMAIVAYIGLFSWQSCQAELFSLNVYTGALIVGYAFSLAGLCFLFLASDAPSRGWRAVFALLAAAGVAGSLLSKQEAGFAILAAGFYFAVTRFLANRTIHAPDVTLTPLWTPFAGLGLGIASAVAVYLALGARVGWDNLMQGLAGYGLATAESARLHAELFHSAWAWFAKLRDANELILPLLALAALIYAGSRRRRWSSFPPLLWALIGSALVAGILHPRFLHPKLTLGWFVEAFSSAVTLALPLVALVYVGKTIHALLFAAGDNFHARQTLVLQSSLFGFVTLLLARFYAEGPAFLPSATASLAGIILVVPLIAGRQLAPLRVMPAVTPHRLAVVALIAVSFGAGMFYAVPGLRSGHSSLPVTSHATDVGALYLPDKNARGLPELLAFVRANTSQEEPVGVLPYSSGLNFVMGRPSPYLQTQFCKKYFTGDLAERVSAGNFSAAPKHVVVVRDAFLAWSTPRSQRDSAELWQMLAGNYSCIMKLGDEQNGFDIYERNRD